MSKDKPPDTTTHTLFVPDELDKKLKMLAKYGKVDDFIIQCIEEGIEPHWRVWIAREYANVEKKAEHENGQGSVRRSSSSDARKAAAKDLRYTRRAKA